MALRKDMSLSQGAASPRPLGTANLRAFEVRRLQTLSGHTALTQDILKTAAEIIQRAMESGAVHARVQTLFLAQNQFTYTGYGSSSDTHPLYDAYTLLPLAGVEKHVVFASCVRDFTHWLLEQGLQFRCTTECFPGGTVPAPFVHLEAYFVPVMPVPKGARAAELWNAVYTQKCVDASAVPAWNQRCADAQRRGAVHFVLCTLYRWSDFYPASHGGGFPCTQPARHYLTMSPLQPLLKQEDNQRLYLNTKFDVMVEWVKETGYDWTLTMDGEQCDWAYFCVLLTPLTQYHQAQ